MSQNITFAPAALPVAILREDGTFGGARAHHL